MRKFTHPNAAALCLFPSRRSDTPRPLSFVPAAADSRHLRNAEKYDSMRKTNAKAKMPRRLLHFMGF